MPAPGAWSKRSAPEHGGLGGIEDFLHAYSLSTKEGLALMVLAEALLRVPDAATADRLIEDKLAAGRWLDGDVKSTALLVSASAWTLGIAARIIHPGETPETILDSIVRRLGLPAMRAATRQAMRLIGSHFVLGQTIDEALARAPRPRRISAIRSTCWAKARAPRPTPKNISTLMPAPSKPSAHSAGNAALPGRPGISVKLSALHPRYEAISRERVLKELTPRLIELAQHGQERTICNSPSMPKKPIGWNFRSRLSAAVLARSRRSTAGTASDLRCRRIRSARLR